MIIKSQRGPETDLPLLLLNFLSHFDSFGSVDFF